MHPTPVPHKDHKVTPHPLLPPGNHHANCLMVRQEKTKARQAAPSRAPQGNEEQSTPPLTHTYASIHQKRPQPPVMSHIRVVTRLLHLTKARIPWCCEPLNVLTAGAGEGVRDWSYHLNKTLTTQLLLVQPRF